MKIKKHYKPLYARLTNEQLFRYIVYHGGRGGAKSWEIAIALILLASRLKLRILCAREVQNSINDSVHKLLKDRITALNLDSRFKVTDKAIVSDSGSEFLFKGIAYDPMQIKSLEGIDICWVEEAQKVSASSWEILIPTIRKENSQIIVSFNPYLATDPTYKKFIVDTPPDTFIKEVNYNDNQHFPETLRKEMEHMKRVDYDLYLHIWEGQCKGSSDAQIFKDKYQEGILDEYVEWDSIPYFGADWGFSQDPTTLNKMYILQTHYGNTLYITHEANGIGVELDNTPALFDTVPESRKFTIQADNARPETINHISKKGFNIVSVMKWPGSIEDGITYMRSFDKIVIHPRCTETINEFKNYSYKTDPKTDEVLTIIIDKFNHHMDAIRYALSKMIRSDLTNYDNLL